MKKSEAYHALAKSERQTPFSERETRNRNAKRDASRTPRTANAQRRIVNTKRIDHNDVLEYRLSMPVNTKFPPLTVENYKLLPETGPRYQLIQGDLYMAPAPNRFHQEISRNLQFELHSYLRRNPVGKLFNAPFDVYLDQINVFQPDIIIVLNERLRILTEDGAEGAPEFIVEILSPKTRRLDLVNKKQEYARAGVKELWIIDPEPRTITIHQFASDGTEEVRQVDEEGILSTALLPGFNLPAKTIFER